MLKREADRNSGVVTGEKDAGTAYTLFATLLPESRYLNSTRNFITTLKICKKSCQT